MKSTDSLTHFFRLNYSLKSRQKIKDHFIISRNIIEYSPNFESSVDFNLNTKDAVVDFYIKGPLNQQLIPSLLTGVNNTINILFKKNYSKLQEYKERVSSSIIQKIEKSEIDNDHIPQIEKFIASSVGFQSSP